MDYSFCVQGEGPTGRLYSTRYFNTLKEAMDYLNLPGVRFGTVYSRYVGGQVIFTNDPEMIDSINF